MLSRTLKSKQLFLRFPNQLQPLKLRPVTYTKRTYATEDKNTNPRLLELMHKMQTTHEVIQALHDFNNIISKKGLTADGSFSSYFLMMKDDEIKNALNKVVIEMNNAGIQVSPDLLEPILEEMSKKKE